MPCCGRRAFTTSPVRWEPISTWTSFSSCAKVLAPSISPSISMKTRAASWPLSSWPGVLAHRASPPDASCCHRATIPTLSSFRVGTRDSFSLSWRPLSHEVPRDPSEGPIGRTQPDSGGGATYRPGSRMDQPLPGPRVCSPSCRQEPVQLRTQPAALRALVGERSSYRRHCQGGSHRIDPARLRALPVQPAACTFCHHHQRPRRYRRSCHPQRVPRRALSGGARLSSALPAPQTDGPGPSEVRVKPVSYTHLRAHETGRNLVCRL